MIFKLFVREAELMYFYERALACGQFFHLVSAISFPQTIPRCFNRRFLFIQWLCEVLLLHANFMNLTQVTRTLNLLQTYEIDRNTINLLDNSVGSC